MHTCICKHGREGTKRDLGGMYGGVAAHAITRFITPAHINVETHIPIGTIIVLT